MWILILCSFLFLVIANYRICPDWRYPPFIMSALWLGAMILVYSSPIPIYAISFVTVLIILAAVVSFTFGGWMALSWQCGRVYHTVASKGTKTGTARRGLRRILLLVSIAFLPVMFHIAQQVIGLSSSENFFVALRTEILAEDSTGYGVVGNASILSFLSTFFYSIELGDTRWEKAEYYLSVLISLLYAILITGRTPILLIVVVLLGIAAIKGRFTFKKLLSGALAFLLSFGLYAVVLGKGGDLTASWSENFSSVGESLLSYAVGPVAAFDQLVRKDQPFTYGENSFSGFLNILYRLTNHKMISPIKEEVAVPFPVNVYTALQPAYTDFGIFGVTLVFFLIGAASAYFYIRATGGDSFYLLCYSLFLFPLIYATFSDQYFAPMLSWAKYIIAGYLYFRIGKRTARWPAVDGTQRIELGFSGR